MTGVDVYQIMVWPQLIFDLAIWLKGMCKDICPFFPKNHSPTILGGHLNCLYKTEKNEPLSWDIVLSFIKQYYCIGHIFPFDTSCFRPQMLPWSSFILVFFWPQCECFIKPNTIRCNRPDKSFTNILRCVLQYKSHEKRRKKIIEQ